MRLYRLESRLWGYGILDSYLEYPVVLQHPGKETFVNLPSDGNKILSFIRVAYPVGGKSRKERLAVFPRIGVAFVELPGLSLLGREAPLFGVDEEVLLLCIISVPLLSTTSAIRVRCQYTILGQRRFHLLTYRHPPLFRTILILCILLKCLPRPYRSQLFVIARMHSLLIGLVEFLFQIRKLAFEMKEGSCA